MSTFQRILVFVAIFYTLYSISTFFYVENKPEMVKSWLQPNDKRNFSASSWFQSSEETNLITNYNNNSKVVIGAVFCRTGNLKGNKYYAQTLVMIKSVLISAKLFNISTVEIHLFLEYLKDQKNFTEDIRKLQFSDDSQKPNVILEIHLAASRVPAKYRKHMIYHPRFRCGYVRFFYPDSLPNVDSIIHLDSDIIVTGNIMRHWDLLGQMDDKQLISMGYNRQPENDKYLDLDERMFAGGPFVQPKGVNSGVLVMNLTRMRSEKVVDQFVEVYEDFCKQVQLHDQKVANILLHYKPEYLKIMPCTLHFLGSDCEKEFYCKAAFDDPDGIHLIHGNDNRFMKGRIFFPVLKLFWKINISDPKVDLVEDLMKPLVEAYVEKPYSENKCFGNLDKSIFKRFLS